MNIALFSDSYLPTKSGVVTVVMQLKRALEHAGHHVVLVTVTTKTELSPEEEKNILHVPSFLSPVGDNQYVGNPFEKSAIDFCRQHNIQIIHAHTEFSLGHIARVVGRKLNIPVIATTHTMWEDYYRYYLKMGRIIPKAVIRRIVHAAYKHFYALINVSQKARDYFKEPYILPSTPSAVIPNAIDTERFKERQVTQNDIQNLRSQFGLSESDRIILYVGRVVEEKRVEELLTVLCRVVRNTEHAKVLFVGDGAALQILKDRVVEEKLTQKILFAGFVDWACLAPYYEISSVFVTASLSEMHSMTVLEAMCMSLPIVCRRDTSFTDTVFHGENGYFADTDEEMDSYLAELVSDDKKAKRMGERSFEISKTFSLSVHVNRTLAFYNAVLKSFPKPVSDDVLEKAVDSAICKGTVSSWS